MKEKLRKRLFFVLFATGYAYCSAQGAQLLMHQIPKEPQSKTLSYSKIQNLLRLLFTTVMNTAHVTKSTSLPIAYT